MLIDVPYDCGRYDLRMGAGPTYLIERGLAESLRTAGHAVRCASVRLPHGFHTEWHALSALREQIAGLVRQARSSGERVLILSGNCAPAALGVLSAGSSRHTAVLWLDAHADFNTPETSPSGFLDGMAVAIAVGHCWRGCARRFQADPVPEEHVIQIGVRSVDDEERQRLEQSRVRRTTPDPASVGRMVDALAGAVRDIYVHLDLDVIDAAELQANEYALVGGPSVASVTAVISDAGARLPMEAAAITALDPSIDGERAWRIAQQLALTIASCP